jgi:hypothetical protein
MLQSGEISPPDLKAGASVELTIPFNQPEVEPGTEYWLSLHFVLAQATKWAPTGHEVAWEQIRLPFPFQKAEPLPLNTMPDIHFRKSNHELVIESKIFKLVLSKTSGTIQSYNLNGYELIERGPMFKGWRAPTDNDDTTWGEQKAAILWRKTGLDRLVNHIQSIEVNQITSKSICVKVKSTSCAPDIEEGFDIQNTYTVYGNGDVIITSDIKPGDILPPLPRIGLELALPPGFDQFTWYGRGPHENYADRKDSSAIGVYTSTVSDQYHPYVKPQETGNKTEVRWAALTNKDGVGLLAIGMPTLEVTALHYSAEDLTGANHTYELKPRSETILNLDWIQTGLGGNSCGPGTLEKYRIFPEPVTYSLCLRPVLPGNQNYADLSKRLPETE